jgi:S1-C subfamily serine protease
VKTDPATGKERAYYAAWPVGERVLDRPGTRHLNFTTGFNNIVHSNLELLATAPDQMRQFTTTATVGGKKQRVKVYAHDPGSLNDVAVLKATDAPGVKFETVPMASRSDLARLKEAGVLDSVAVIGFPRGITVLEIGRATPSPTIGNIRKVEHTIHVSAPISPGNSGGPLVNLEGKVIGIATRIITAEAETHGVCLPITKAYDLLPKEYIPK